MIFISFCLLLSVVALSGWETGQRYQFPQFGASSSLGFKRFSKWLEKIVPPEFQELEEPWSVIVNKE